MAYSEQDFDEELRARLGQDAPLPPGMDWEAMRNGIKARADGKPKPRKAVPIWWWPGICTVLLLVISFTLGQIYHYVTVPETGTVTVAGVLPKAQARNREVALPNAPAETVLTGELSEPVTSPQNGTAPAAGFHYPERNTKLSTNVLKPITAPSVNESLTDRMRDAEKELIPDRASDSIARSQTAPSHIPDAENRPDKAPPAPAEIKPVAVSPLAAYSFYARGDFLPVFQLKTGTAVNSDFMGNDDGEKVPAKPDGWRIDLVAGTQLASSTYRGDNVAYADFRSETETPLPGHHLALGLVKPINDNWQLRTGLTYDRYRARTDLEGTRVFNTTFQDVPLRIDVSGDTIFGAAELQVTESREFRSFLREQRLSVPLLAGRQFRLGGSLFALRAGPEFGLLIGSGGKVLREDRSSRLLSDADFLRLNVSVRFEGELAIPVGAAGPWFIGRVGVNQVLGGGGMEVRRGGRALTAGIGMRMPL